MPRQARRPSRLLSGVPAATVPIEGGRGYSRLSLSLVRHEPELPFTDLPRLERSADAVPYLHQLLEAEPFEILGALFLTIRTNPSAT